MLPISLHIERRPLQVVGLSSLTCPNAPLLAAPRRQLPAVRAPVRSGAPVRRCCWFGAMEQDPLHATMGGSVWKGGKGAQIAQSTGMSCRPSVSLLACRQTRPPCRTSLPTGAREGYEGRGFSEVLRTWNVCRIKCPCVSFDLEMPGLPVARVCAVISS
jgi:hypothetical protein